MSRKPEHNRGLYLARRLLMQIEAGVITREEVNQVLDGTFDSKFTGFTMPSVSAEIVNVTASAEVTCLTLSPSADWVDVLYDDLRSHLLDEFRSSARPK